MRGMGRMRALANRTLNCPAAQGFTQPCVKPSRHPLRLLPPQGGGRAVCRGALHRGGLPLLHDAGTGSVLLRVCGERILSVQQQLPPLGRRAGALLRGTLLRPFAASPPAACPPLAPPAAAGLQRPAPLPPRSDIGDARLRCDPHHLPRHCGRPARRDDAQVTRAWGVWAMLGYAGLSWGVRVCGVRSGRVFPWWLRPLHVQPTAGVGPTSSQRVCYLWWTKHSDCAPLCTTPTPWQLVVGRVPRRRARQRPGAGGGERAARRGLRHLDRRRLDHQQGGCGRSSPARAARFACLLA